MKSGTMENARAKLEALISDKLKATRAAGSSMDEHTARAAAQGQLEWDLHQAAEEGDEDSGELLDLMQKDWNLSDPAKRAARLLGTELPPQATPPKQRGRLSGADAVETLG